MKTVLRGYKQPEGHWVGDGFPVHTVLDYGRHPELSPFLLLDHAGPFDFPAATAPRGVGWHPHRGFETVTVVLDGEVDHEDTAGNGGRIGRGDVQWMTAGSGLLHKEMHSPEFTRKGGRFHALQLWVNLPAKSKMSAPKYQTLLAREIPTVNLTGGASLRVIAGEFRGAKGPASTFTPVDLFELRIPAGRDTDLVLRKGFSAGLYVVQGKITVNRESASEGELIVLDRNGSEVAIEASADALVFVMSGEAINEPVAGSGPFVMNTRQDLEKAYADFHSGRMGRIPQTEKEKALS
jgi:redox-sensitive bicupin YhaK (pirin superfamily)